MIDANRKRPRYVAAAVAAGALACTAMTTTAALAAQGTAASAARGTAASAARGTAASAAQAAPAASAAQHTAYGFYTFDNAGDPTFNQLLGINNEGLIAGYFGSGAQGHPNKGYLLAPPWQQQADFAGENFPGSVQTQVTGLNDRGDTVGFWSSMNNANQVNDNVGFYVRNGAFHSVQFPTGNNANPPVNQLLGINNHEVAVGFYVNAQGSFRGYTYDIRKKTFTRVQVPGAATGTQAPSLTAAAINNHGDVAGFYANAATGNTDAFVLKNGQFTDVAYPGASATQALGLNDRDELVGTYTAGTAMHGFTWTPGGGFKTLDDPNGAGTTVINGVNNAGDLVGFYTDANGNTDGYLAEVKTTVWVNLTPMPAGNVVVGKAAGQPAVTVSAFGLTPGSAHTVLLKGNPIGTLTADGTGDAAATFAAGGVPGGSRVKILDGDVGTDVIARTNPLNGKGTYQLHALEAGFPQGSLHGKAALVFDPAAGTLSVTVNATGVSQGMHAAHIHLGSCLSQGPVAYMLMDFTANGQGKIQNETRTIASSIAPLAPSGWYLNLHQGNSNDILSNGNPTILFRPLLCANI
jgi:hypothetical protein